MAQLPKISLIGAERRVHFLKAHFFLGALIFFLFFFWEGFLSFCYETRKARGNRPNASETRRLLTRSKFALRRRIGAPSSADKVPHTPPTSTRTPSGSPSIQPLAYGSDPAGSRRRGTFDLTLKLALGPRFRPRNRRHAPSVSPLKARR